MNADPLDAARRLFAGPIAFERGVASLDDLPADDLPEVALAGRSNVGKSSLLNALAGRRGLARVSDTPGRTQELNLFLVGRPASFRLVDMPGYGFAQAPRELVRRWTRLVRDYLVGRPTLRRVFLLIDARHGLKDLDREVMDRLEQAAVSFQLVLTKADKVARVEPVRQAVAAEARTRTAAHPQVLATSSLKGWGLPELRAAVRSAALGLDFPAPLPHDPDFPPQRS
ncbi:MAG: ribosome biogenesis GTP-binding protein YihA/YsxC [Sphingomonadaceae bacterium]|uniref:ribosome biogenesis GTP-binding protein YihA/YsxC n=1 Tax=Thermaurantiacus sp. TaxID=2820283 RepID=UPI00298F20FD|nr:ribosome biogenesis GTP-binding protein YihA/YsxC [Thermaurantiacus sp.]MCS6987293.1 ribosome biogenesis GTP-binding protein YihA/YsxC [Sphingomonadaceae bacterium]MDW8414513.1 ribosome biogenesis GTP-binding protein YihA/YsxC [Thermaurantiacus sp.]